MTYADHQRTADREYVAAYKAWLGNLSPAERAKLEAKGLAKPDASHTTDTPRGGEAAIACAVSQEPAPNEPRGEQPERNWDLRELVVAVLSEIVYSDNAQLKAEIMAIASGCAGFTSNGIVTRIAAKHSTTRAAVSKRVVEFCERWGMKPSVAMKSEAARAKYSVRNQPRIA